MQSLSGGARQGCQSFVSSATEGAVGAHVLSALRGCCGGSGDSDGALLPHSKGSSQFSRGSFQCSSGYAKTVVGIGLLPCFLPSSVEPP